MLFFSLETEQTESTIKEDQRGDFFSGYLIIYFCVQPVNWVNLSYAL